MQHFAFAHYLKLSPLAAVLFVLTSGLTASGQKGAWPEVGYNGGHTGYNSGETTINTTDVTSLAKIQTFATTAQIITQPVVSDGIVYIDSSDNYLYAYDVSTGALAWKVDAGTNIDAPTGIVLAGARVVVTCSYSGYGLCAYNAKTGKALWSYGIGTSFTAPAISGDTIYYGTSGMFNNTNWAPMFVAVNVSTGAELWRFWSCNNSVTCVQFGSATPAIADSLVYVACQGAPDSGYSVTIQGVCGLNTSNGDLVWQTQIGTSGDVFGISASASDVFASSITDNCYGCNYTIDDTALNAKSGAVVWNTAITGTLNNSYTPTGAPAVGPGGTIYQSISDSDDSTQPNLFALNASNGKIKWSESTALALQGLPRGITGTIVSKGTTETLFYTCGSSYFSCAFNASNGSLLWQSPDYQGNNYPPVVTGGTVYNMCGYNNVCAYQP